MTLRCFCCGEPYERGRFRCCAPPKNMASHQWREMFCSRCGTATSQKCPKHCVCETNLERHVSGPFRQWAKGYLEELWKKSEGQSAASSSGWRGAGRADSV